MACELNFADSPSVTWSATTDAAGNISYVATSVGGSSQAFIYVPCDETIHTPGSIAGDGSTANPIQIPVNPKHAVRLEDIDPAAGTGGDDTAALMGAIDQSLAERTRVQLDGKTYNFDQPVVIPASKETCFIEGCGGEAKRFDTAGYSDGSVLNSRIASGTGFTFENQVQTQIRDLTFSGVTSDFVVKTNLAQMTVVENVAIYADGANTSGLKTDYAFTNIYKNIDIYKRDQSGTGTGFWHDTTVGSEGGNVLMENVTASYFKNNIELGQEAAANQGLRLNNTFINIQGRFGETGIRVGSGYGHNVFINPWGEYNTYAQFQIHSGAGSQFIYGSNFEGVPRTGFPTGFGLVLGLDPALGNNIPICPVTVRGGRIRAWGGAGGVKIFPPATVEPDVWHELDAVEFWNNGGPRIVTDAVAQMPVLYRRPKKNDSGNFWNNNNVMLTPAGTAYQAPLALQTTPFTQV